MRSRITPGVILLLWCLSASVMGQVSIGGQPPTFADQSLPASVPTKLMPSLDIAALLAQDAAEPKDVPLRFGYPFEVNYNLKNSGEWQTLSNGDRLWRLRIAAPGAYSINLIYDHFWLPEGARLFLYNEDHSYLIGAFTNANNKETGDFATAPVKGDVTILEYVLPANAREDGEISIATIVHAYRNLFDRHVLGEKDFGESGSCNVNINCPQGADWQDIKRGVAMILTGGGSRLCSGMMINNVRQDLTPYFLTANHCLGYGPTTYIMMFNYESPGCTSVDGPTYMTTSGTIVRASNSYSDFGLLELLEQPPDSYNVYFLGWDATDVAGDSVCAIHHPAGDIKKISFEYDLIATSNYLGTAGSGDSHWRVEDWDMGTTEGGSSGSPLLSKSKLILGQLHGGWAACGNDTSDYYGKFSKSWNYGTTADTRLIDWLDPDNTGTLVLAGRALGITITHTGLSDTKETVNPYEVVCMIKSTHPLVPASLLLYYDVGSGYVSTSLTATGGTDEYHAYIPAQSPGTEIDYYLMAADTTGDADTTGVYHFRVIDYAVSMAPASLSSTGAVGDTVWYNLTVKNGGIYADDFGLAAAGAFWTTNVYDFAGTSIITSTGTLSPDDSLRFKVAVVVPPSFYGDKDSIAFTATSSGDPAVKAVSTIVTVSAGEPLTIPFYDPFPSTTIDMGKWVLSSGCAVNGTGTNPPSTPYAVNLNGDPVGADTLMSQAIDLSGLADISLTYSYEQTGGGESPDAADDLFVEFLDNTSTWVLLHQHLGADADMTTFQEVLTYLPASAYHAGFRVRFRNTATAGAYDDWFVDDIKVDVNYPPEISVSPLSFSETLLANDSVSRSLTINNFGLGSLNYAASVQFITNKRDDLLASLRQSGQLAPATRTYPEEYDNYVEQKGVPDPRVGYPQDKNAGGPDAFGYYWVDSDQPGGPTFSWTDIAASGYDIVNGLIDDTVIGPFGIGFPFSYYGTTYTQFYVSSNGIIGFNNTNMRSLSNTALPNSATPNDIIAWMWDDLNPKDAANPGAHVYIDTTGGQCVIQFTNYPEYQASAGDVITAQVILQPDGTVLIKYKTIAPGFDLTSSSIGMENAAGTDGLQVTYNATYGHDNLLVKFFAPYRWFGVTPTSGLVAAQSQTQLAVTVRSGDLDTGLYNGNIILTNNDPDHNPVTVPVQLHVIDVPPYVCGDVDNNSIGPDIGDITYMVGFLFFSEPPPPVYAAADVNGDLTVDITDITIIVAYLFQSGPPPTCAP